MMMKMMIGCILLLLFVRGKSEEQIFSGDGESSSLTAALATLINENGDIENTSASDWISDAMVSAADNETALESSIGELAFNYSPSNSSTTESIKSATELAFSGLPPLKQLNDGTTVAPEDSITITEKSTTVTENPSTITENSNTVTENHSTITEKHSTVTESPSTGAQSPTTIAAAEESSTSVSTLTPTTTLTSTTRKSTSKMPTPVIEEADMSSKVYPATPFKPTHVPGVDEQCVFIDDGLDCTESIVCYGEGIIDCTDFEDADTNPETISAIDETPLLPVSEDYSDYQGGGDGIETFPPYLVGVKSEAKNSAFLYRMKGLKETDLSSVSSETTEEKQINAFTTVTPMKTYASVPHAIEISSTESKEPDTTAFHTEILSDVTTISMKKPVSLPNLKEISTAAAVPETTTVNVEISDFSNSTHTDSINTEELTSATPSSMDSLSSKLNEESLSTNFTSGVMKMDDVISTVKSDSFEMGSTPSSILEVSKSTEIISDESHVRRPREVTPVFESNSSVSLSLRKATVESSKYRKRFCKLSGSLVCLPNPTTSKCKGQTFCRAVNNTKQTEKALHKEQSSEKSLPDKGIESWTIAVIAVCAIAAALTVFLFIYLLFTSYKKQKVQPQSGITTLNYINSNAP